MIISFSGAVGSGKTTIASKVAKKLNCEIIHLNDLAKKYKIESVDEIQTFDFDLDKLLDDLEEDLKKSREKNIILEGHFSHFVNPKLVDVLFVINRDLKELKKEYLKRKYNDQKIADNLEVESFNLCFYEAEEEGYQVAGVAFQQRQSEEDIDENSGIVYSINNDKELDFLVEKIVKKIEIVGEKK